MRVRTFPMYGFCEGFLAIFGRARAPRNGRLDIFQTFIVTLHPLFEQRKMGRRKTVMKFFSNQAEKKLNVCLGAPSV